jgi:hypothetical protein
MHSVTLLAFAAPKMLVKRLGQRRMVLVGGAMVGVGYLAFLLSPWLAVGIGTYLFTTSCRPMPRRWHRPCAAAPWRFFAFCLFTG